MNKQIGIIGLGNMGENMALNLLDKKYKVVVYNRDKRKVRKVSKLGATSSLSFREFSNKISKPRTILIIITAGKPIDEILKNLTPFLNRGDIIIDGGNSNYEDSIKRYNLLKKKGIHFLDAGISGGLSGARHGASITVGGERKIYHKIEPLLKDLSVRNGYGYFGKSGAGHFLKTVHNGIEYSLLESYAEGYEILKKSKYNFNLREVSRVWNNGSVIRSWITELAEKIFSRNSKLRGFEGKIGGGETGMWSIKIAEKEKADAQTIKHALMKRKKSMNKQSFSTKFVSAIRKEFGGHREP